MGEEKRIGNARPRHLLRSFGDELAMAVRTLVRRPGRVLAPGIILALAVALNVLVFTVVRAVLLAPLPFHDASRVAVVEEVTQGYGLSRASYPVLEAWRRDARSVTSVAGYLDTGFPLQTQNGAVEVKGAAVTRGFFDFLDDPILLGRVPPPSAYEPDAAPTVLISGHLWHTVFAGDPNIVGRTLDLNGRKYPVSGVVRDRARFPDGADLWVPLPSTYPDLAHIAGAKIIVALARLRPGATLGSVAHELGTISAGVTGGAKTASAVSISSRLLGDVRTPLLLLEGAVLLVLLGACANAGSMLLARGVRRRAEIAVRASVGAGAGRVAAGLLMEGLVLGVGSGLVGLAVAAVLLKPALALVPRALPRAGEIHLDVAVGLFALGLSALTGLVTALAPALAGAKTSPAALLREAPAGSGTSPWLRRVLEGFVVGQVALALLLTVGAGLLVRSFIATIRENPGFDPSHVTLADVSLPTSRYPDAASRLDYAHRLLQKGADIPGAEAVALGRNLPISGSTMTSPLMVRGVSKPTSAVQVALVSRGYFDVLHIPVIRGRVFSAGDRQNGPPTMVVDPEVRTADGTKVGVGSYAHSFFSDPDFRDVIGVVGAVRHDGLRSAPPPTAYEPFFQKGGASSFTFMVRSSAPEAVVAGSVRRLMRDLDPQIPVEVGTMSSRISRSLAEPRFYTLVLSLFGALAVLLALAGCQAGLAHRVAARRHEIGLRMAMGATRSSVLGMVLRRGLALTLAGAAIGIVFAFPATRLLKSQLYRVSANDPITYVGLLVLLLATAALASYLPARRASSVDPAEVLREG